MRESTPLTPTLTDEELLTITQRYTFKYFWDHADANSGMAYERLPVSGGPGPTVTSGALDLD